MDYRLLVDLEVVLTLEALPKAARQRFLDRFQRLRSSPAEYSDTFAYDADGRRVDMSIFAHRCCYY